MDENNMQKKKKKTNLAPEPVLPNDTCVPL